MTLTEFALGTQGLIAHYPIHGDGNDVSGNGYHLSNVNNEYPVYFSGMILNSDLMPSYAISLNSGEDGVYHGSYLSVSQPPGIKCVSLYVGMPEETDTLGAFFTLNGLYDPVLSNDRINIAWRFNELRVGNGVGGSDSETGVGVSSLKGKKIHVLVQETSNGQGYEIIIDGVMLYSDSNRNIFNMLINDPNRLFAVGTHTYNQQGSHIQVWCAGVSLYNRRLTDGEIETLVGLSTSVPVVMSQSFVREVWSNKETIAQANPQPDVLQYLKQSQLPTLATKQGDYLSTMDQKGNQRPMGYFESKVLIQDVPAPNRKVMCFTQHGQLLDETRSDALGNYRFDHLLLDTRYLFVAQDNRATPDTPPEYQAVAAGFQSATPYVED